MTSPLEGSLAATIGQAMSFLFLDATLARDVAGTITDPADPPVPTEASYTCKAIVEDYAERFRLDGTVKFNERKVLILATTLSVTPLPNDRITIRSATYTVMAVASDPALATWELKVRS